MTEVGLYNGRLILAGRPTDLTGYNAEVQKLLAELDVTAPYEPGWRDMECVECGRALRIGPRQRSQYEVSPDSYWVMDLLCAAQIGGTDRIVSLGGR